MPNPKIITTNSETKTDNTVLSLLEPPEPPDLEGWVGESIPEPEDLLLVMISVIVELVTEVVDEVTEVVDMVVDKVVDDVWEVVDKVFEDVV